MDENSLPFSLTFEVRDRCLCLHAQRAARTLARFFDDRLKPFGLTNGQFSLLMSLNRPIPPRLTDLVPLLGMDRTTLTAALKPLQRRGLADTLPDDSDGRVRRILLTPDGREILVRAMPVWRTAHDELDARLASLAPETLRSGLNEIL